jgi:hypothetical protein
MIFLLILAAAALAGFAASSAQKSSQVRTATRFASGPVHGRDFNRPDRSPTSKQVRDYSSYLEGAASIFNPSIGSAGAGQPGGTPAPGALGTPGAPAPSPEPPAPRVPLRFQGV